MHHLARSMIPLVTAGAVTVVVCTGCTAPSSSQYAAGTSASGGMSANMAGAPNTPALASVRAFDLGPVVVDGGEYIVYRYDKDSANPPRSTCNGACAQQWKPVPGSAAQHLTGLDATKVATLTRDDGNDQATLNGWPLYRYAKDEMPGETAGMGIGGVWFPIKPDGTKVTVVANPGASDAFGL